MINILFEDNHLLIAFKPHHIATQTEPDGKEGFDDMLKRFIKNRDLKPGNVFLHALHRLDKPVAGIVVFAKTQKALSRCSESLRNKFWEKEYQAVVEGNCRKIGHIQHFLKRDHARVVAKETDSPDAKEALLEILDAKAEGTNTILTIKLHSGRHHQIRAQLAALGHPIIGDFRYGAKKPFQSNAIALTHSKLRLPHPVLDADIEINALSLNRADLVRKLTKNQ